MERQREPVESRAGGTVASQQSITDSNYGSLQKLSFKEAFKYNELMAKFDVAMVPKE